MLLVDRDIHELIKQNALYTIDEDWDKDMSRYVGAISYDLHTACYVKRNTANLSTYDLQPSESIFVSCHEAVNMPKNLSGRIVLRNSRIRQGFELDAPAYQPGHNTRIFFRLTNISDKIITLKENDDFASIMFEQLNGEPDHPYQGTFQKEMSYTDMADYKSRYESVMKDIDEKANELKSMEKNIYANIITMMSIFIALFSLININIDLAYAKAIDQSRLIISNLVTVGSIAFLVSLIQMCFSKKNIGVWIVLLVVALALLGVATYLVIL